jgi:pantothenate synthetase
MDDLKLIGKKDELQKQMQVFRKFIDDIHMEFGLDKCTKTVLKKGKLVHSQNLILTSTQKYKSPHRENHTST